MLLIINRLGVLRIPDIHPAFSASYTWIFCSRIWKQLAFTIIQKNYTGENGFCAFICIISSLESKRVLFCFVVFSCAAL